LRVFENRVLRRSGPKRREVEGDWKSLYNEELHKLYSSPNIIMVIKQEDEMGGVRCTHGTNEKCVQYFDQKV